MKTLAKTLLIGVLVVNLTTCRKAYLTGDYFIFGSSYGECNRNCVDYFLLKKDNLYPDDMTRPAKRAKFKNERLAREKVALAKELRDGIPDFLKNSTTDRFGCPDCRDQGAYYIELRDNGKTQKFYLDTDTTAVPRELRTFVAKIGTTLSQL